MMMNFMTKRWSFILEEKDVTIVLNIINHCIHLSDLCVANCGWGGGLESKWFIVFHTTGKTYGKIVKELQEIGKFTLDVRPGGQVDTVFERV